MNSSQNNSAANSRVLSPREQELHESWKYLGSEPSSSSNPNGPVWRENDWWHSKTRELNAKIALEEASKDMLENLAHRQFDLKDILDKAIFKRLEDKLIESYPGIAASSGYLDSTISSNDKPTFWIDPESIETSWTDHLDCFKLSCTYGGKAYRNSESGSELVDLQSVTLKLEAKLT
ncbi:uncharacterized protein L201_003133 [Kwoniella dendrophila CBS 6074]|uniref:Uncharacterized protein n=1 Tax=Kwoniella dendrophila CBS 6074 TaxID=1295534 RepID=A0AAX4JUN9_9TREE